MLTLKATDIKVNNIVWKYIQTHNFVLDLNYNNLQCIYYMHMCMHVLLYVNLHMLYTHIYAYMRIYLLTFKKNKKIIILLKPIYSLRII